ncbi:hypothetical protein ACP4OV_007511 [Aristida adscensionis]
MRTRRRRRGYAADDDTSRRTADDDVVLEIAARSDAPTLIRCAATCRGMRGRVVGDPAFLRGRLRLRHATGRFVPPLLRGHLLQIDQYCDDEDEGIHLVAGAAARPLTAAEGFPPPSGRHKLVSSRDGLLLVRTTAAAAAPPHRLQVLLRVCDPATGRSHTLPPEPEIPFGRPFMLLKARLVAVSEHRRYLQLQTFSPVRGAWASHADLRTPRIHGNRIGRLLLTPLVAGGAVHWLYLTSSAGYILKLHAGEDRVSVSVTALPETFPRSDDQYQNWWTRYLLATTTAAAGGSPAVLVADTEKISVWAQSEQKPGSWKPQVVILKTTIVPYGPPAAIQLLSFGERSGVMLVRIYGRHYLLDLSSMARVREFKVSWCPTLHCPYEDLPSWVPTFSKTL